MFTHQELLDNTDKLRRFSLKLTRNAADSDDLLQSTLLRAIEKQALYQDNSNLLGWSSRIMFNIFISDKRKSNRMEYGCEPEGDNLRLTSPATQMERMELLELQEALKELPAIQQDVVRLVCIEELSYEEAAQQLQVPIGTIRSRLARARKRLAELTGNDAVTMN